jgi:hypothetical protein
MEFDFDLNMFICRDEDYPQRNRYDHCLEDEQNQEQFEQHPEFDLDPPQKHSQNGNYCMLGKRDLNDLCSDPEASDFCETLSIHRSQLSNNLADPQESISEIGSDRLSPPKSQLPRSTVIQLKQKAPEMLIARSPIDKTDLKLFSEITLNLLRKHGEQGLTKQKIEDKFIAELTARALSKMSDDYCLRRRLNLILLVLKSPAIGLVEEIRDPAKKRIKIIRLTPKHLNSETFNLINLVEDRVLAVERKQQKLVELQHILSKLEETIHFNKIKNCNSVSICTFDSSGRMISTPVSGMSSNRVSLNARVYPAGLTKVAASNTTQTVLLSSQENTSGSSLLNKLFGSKH